MASPPTDPAPLLQRFIGLMHRKTFRESIVFMHESGLTMPQIVVLFVLRHADASVSELAARLRMSMPATSQLLDRLVAAELVSRSESATDRRVRRLAILPAGLRYLERFGEVRAREIAEGLRSLTPGCRQLLAAALARAVTELEGEFAGEAAPPTVIRPRRTARRRP